MWPYSCLTLIMTGSALVGIGLYFLFVRPALLHEDLRYMGVSTEELLSVRPQLEAWLLQVFRVLGGYVAATGALTITLAATAYRAHQPGSAVGALIAGVASIGLMVFVNFRIGSDFKWALFAVALLWTCSLVLYYFERRAPA